MEVFSLQETPGARFQELDVPKDPNKSVIDNWKTEIEVYYGQMKRFNQMDVTEIFESLSSFSARASEIRTLLTRDISKRSQTFRTQEIDPFLAECDRQFKIHSRILSVKQQEWDMAKGIT